MTSTSTQFSRIAATNIPEEKRERIMQDLNVLTASALELRTQVKYAHWNMHGLQFAAIHPFLDDLVAHLDTFTDDMAERVTTIGGTANATLRWAAENSILPATDTHARTPKEHVSSLIDRYAVFVTETRKAIGRAEEVREVVTADLLTEVAGIAEKDGWMLEAHFKD